MAWVYLRKGAKRHYLGSTVDLDAGLPQHGSGDILTRQNASAKFELVASKEFATLSEPRRAERMLKAKKNPNLARY